MKAQSFFGGTNPKESGTHVRQVGKTGKSTAGGVNITRKTGVKQVGTYTGSPHNSQMVRDKNFATKAVKGRPSLSGKEDNRTSWK